MTTVVVGAGLSGLARAYALACEGQPVRLLEESDRPGGVVRSERRDGFLLELGPNTVRPTPQLWDLVRELGLEKEALRTDPRAPRFVDFAGRLHAVPMSLGGLLSTRLLSPAGKFRILGEPFVSAAREEGESVLSFFTRRLGAQVAERLAAPFVSGIYAGDAARLSVQSCFPKLARWERERGSLLRGMSGELSAPRPKRVSVRGLLSFREGLEALPRALAARLGAALEKGVRVEKISRAGGGFELTTSKGDVFAESVVLATPAFHAARLVEELSPPAASVLRQIEHPPLAVLHLCWSLESFPSPLRGFGHLVAPGSPRRILGAVYSSSLFAGRAPEGVALVTVFLGGARDPAAASLPDQELVAAAARDLAAALGVRGEPRLVALTRHSAAIPQYGLCHEKRISELQEAEAGCPGLSFLGSYRGGISVGDVVGNALTL